MGVSCAVILITMNLLDATVIISEVLRSLTEARRCSFFDEEAVGIVDLPVLTAAVLVLRRVLL